MLDSIVDLFIHTLKPLSFFISTNKRIYCVYLLSALLLMGWCYRKRTHVLRAYLRITASKKYWFNRSTKIDLKWITINQVLGFFGVIPLLSGQLSWALQVYRQLVECFGVGDFLIWPSVYVTLLFTVTIFICEDFSRFFMHYCYHKVPFLWRFHAIHHSAVVMTPLTLYRIHFIEYFLNACRALVVTGSVSGIFMYCFHGKISTFQILGASIFAIIFNIAGANLRHSHIWLSFGKFEHAFISPAQHQIHHSSSQQHLDKNFGSTLAIWDKLFGTWLSSHNQTVTKFGLYKQSNKQTLKHQILGIKP